MTQTIIPRCDPRVLEFHGRMDSHTAGQTYDRLVAVARSGHPNLVVDLSGVDCMTRAGVRGLVVAARLMMVEGGAMRICGAGPRATELLLGMGYRHLLKLDGTRAQSLAILARCGGMAPSIPDVLAAPAGAATPMAGRSHARRDAARSAAVNRPRAARDPGQPLITPRKPSQKETSK